MKTAATTEPPARLVLRAGTASDLMTPNAVSIQDTATVKEAIAFLTNKGYSAAPVIDEAGRPVGVLSQADILARDRAKAANRPGQPAGGGPADLGTRQDEAELVQDGFQIEDVDRTPVRDIMTPVVYSVTPETPVEQVIEEMHELQVHRLYVVDKDGVLTGVITTLDVLRHLLPGPV